MQARLLHWRFSAPGSMATTSTSLNLRALLKTAMRQLSLSARAFHRVLKVARTVADLAGSDGLRAEQVAEAIQYRRRGPLR